MPHNLNVEGQNQFSGRDVAFAAGIIVILTVLFLPVPAFVLDLGLSFSIAFSVLILMVSLWIQRPLDFSAFPTVLLIATMLRLSLNIATTRVILTHGNEGYQAAGHVIHGFSQFVMGGDFVIGLVVFAIVIIVNFLVITKGATRIAEVGARFTLDAIPGKQMAIDADLSSGLIDEKEAQSRRRELEEESSFFGAMDGASKFVRGDAIAGLIITAVNIFGGIVIGVTRHGMTLSGAADVFTKLSVGDGLVTQIPALIVSLAAGLLVSKGGTRGSAEKAVLGQLGGYPKALFVSSMLLLMLGLMPGLPAFPFILLGCIMAAIGYSIPRRLQKEALAQEAMQQQAAQRASQEDGQSVKASLEMLQIEIAMGKQLSQRLLPQQVELANRVAKMRRKFAQEYGFVIPEIQVSDDYTVPAKNYWIKLHGTVVASYEMRIGDVLIMPGNKPIPNIPGEQVKEPAFGMSAFSTSETFRSELVREGYIAVDNLSVLLTHLSEVLRNNLAQLFSYRDMRIMLERLGGEYRKLLEEICPAHLSYSGLQSVLKLLLSERISIRNLHLILEAVAEVAPHVRRSDLIVEHVRLRLSQQICGDLSDGGVLNVLRMGSRWDLAFQKALKFDTKGEIVEFDLDPMELEKFGTEASVMIRQHMEKAIRFVLITSPQARPYVRMIMERLFPTLPVLSHAEIARGVEVKTLGVLS
ncbi:flagellar biosynthesis protein flhA [Bartonella bacilliformis Peru38]|uniref:Flagellar biosynthesis protein FlhA n=2 Tax=Bartonella bacilliformis TaxID=774 RepID=A1UTW6_BARBK|nr:flagellar biosynthesis protein FlhA [Bartonella bacilliformis KC583]AMG86163.1 flagellar biosynthesis protein FlhA [Bartonella bacilliformis]EKS43057.1 flagellar biosynthesis protein FlhA [Bartonella bacilliformis INS]EYS88603.1 flagellar biosynthesis protein flhA [Bartonella bacilliformis San Pedro600-02]EYS94419.1 flagellar biosynthesis protein flhA [Bartonella bacilliformis Peru-18]KEG15906.1 flagellar biosynthesis protein flhA [Bartonella bacilliformis CUSCO5]KEG19809.1 flagellar biosy